jgi:1-aminocyclopropane-1-carboxylate deaminase/D-cysteine desulfhydrase-like pyridoxal-dependent ACC family enzyme
MHNMTPLSGIRNDLFEKSIDLRIKRDDLYPLTGGGNKARKIEYISKYAVNNGYNALVTNGGEQSNHARATALAAADLGLKSSIVLHVNNPNDPRKLCGNMMLIKMSGADIRFCCKADLSTTMDEEMDRLKAEGYKPLYIWGGGHCLQGSLAYYDAAQEAQSQCADWIPDYIIHASGTGTTQAGLIAGYAHLPTKVIGVSVARDKKRGAQVIQKSLNELGDYMGKDFTEADVDLRDNWIEGGYESISDRLINAVDEAALKGLILDPTYAGKAYLGLKSMVKTGSIPKGSKVLFWHTGGLLNLLSSPEYLTINI